MRICFSYDKNGSFQDTVLLGLATAQVRSQVRAFCAGSMVFSCWPQAFSLPFLPDLATTPPGTMLRF